MTYILHIDTSGDTGTVMLAANGKVVAEKVNNDARNHAAFINIYIEEIIKENNLSLPQIDALAVCGGPGSYTGLRIGLATAKGLCYALDKPLLLHNKLILLSIHNYHKHLSEYEQYVAVLPARDKEYFFSIHNNNFEFISEPQHIFEDELGKIIDETDKKTMLATGGTIEIKNNNNIYIYNNQSVNMQAWATYAFEQYNCNGFVNLSTAEPFYLKEVYTHNQKKNN